MTSKIEIYRQILGLWAELRGPFWPFSGSKIPFSQDFLKFVLEQLRSCLGIVFCLKSYTFRCIFSWKSWYMTSKIKILGQTLALREGHVDHFQGQKTRFPGFLKVSLELSKSYFGFQKCIFTFSGTFGAIWQLFNILWFYSGISWKNTKFLAKFWQYSNFFILNYHYITFICNY